MAASRRRVSDEEDLRARSDRSRARALSGRSSTSSKREAVHHFERAVMLQTLDTHWREHLAALDHLRQGIHLRGYAQKNPKQEYKREAFELFSMMLDAVRNEVTRILMTVQIRSAAGCGGGRRAGRDRATCSTSMPTTMPHWPKQRSGGQRSRHRAEAAAVRAPGRESRAQRSLPVRIGQEVQAVPRPAVLRSPAQAHRAIAPDTIRITARPVAVNLPPPSTDQLLPVAGVTLGIAQAGIRKANRADLLLIKLAEASARRRRSSRTTVFARRLWWWLADILTADAAIRALVINTGNANAGTGERGLQARAAKLR